MRPLLVVVVVVVVVILEVMLLTLTGVVEIAFVVQPDRLFRLLFAHDEEDEAEDEDEEEEENVEDDMDKDKSFDAGVIILDVGTTLSAYVSDGVEYPP